MFLFSSASLPPQSITRQPGLHRTLRAQPSGGAPSQSQPAWTFIGNATSSRNTVVNRNPVSWQASAPQYQASSSNNTVPQANALCAPRVAQLDPQTSYVSDHFTNTYF